MGSGEASPFRALLPTWLACLPLKEDEEEAEFCHASLLAWVEGGVDAVVGERRRETLLALAGVLVVLEAQEKSKGGKNKGKAVARAELRARLERAVQALGEGAGEGELAGIWAEAQGVVGSRWSS